MDLESVVREIEQNFQLKETTGVGDVVLIVAEQPLSMLYALVVGIERDVSRRDEWWQVSMQILSFPPQEAVWTLRTPQFTGQEIFTMAGEKRFVKALRFDVKGNKPAAPPPEAPEKPSLRRIK